MSFADKKTESTGACGTVASFEEKQRISRATALSLSVSPDPAFFFSFSRVVAFHRRTAMHIQQTGMDRHVHHTYACFHLLPCLPRVCYAFSDEARL